MGKTILIVTMGDRLNRFTALLDSIATQRQLDDYGVVAVLQEYEEPVRHARLTDALYLPKGIGPGGARLAALRKWESDFWVNYDDDMLATENTNYDAVYDWLLSHPGAGLVSCNNRRVTAKKLPQLVERFDRQPLVYTGGGLCYRDDVVDVLLTMDDLNYLFDDTHWSMWAYIHGFNNFRYKGSLAIHDTLTEGGRKAWVGKETRPLSPSDLITPRATKQQYYPGTDNSYHIPTSSDLTPYARQLHKENLIG